MAKRPDGTGSKDVLPSGKIRCRVRLNGKRVTRIYADDAQADRFLRGAAALASDGEHDISVPRLGTWGAKWLEKRQNVAAAHERGLWRNHIDGSDLADLPVQDVRLRHLRAWAEQELPQHRVRVRAMGGGHRHIEGTEPISVGTRQLCVGLVRRVLSAALEEELITVNPAAGLRVKWLDTSLDDGMGFLEEAEIVRLLGCEAVPVAARLHYGWAIGAGPRQGESRALRWSDLDLDGRRCTIRRSGQRETTKGEKVRPFAVLPLAAESMLHWRELAPDTRPDALVWPARLLPPAPGGTRWRTVKDKLHQRGEGNDFGWADRQRGKRGERTGHRSLAGIREGITYHDLRHTCCAGLLRGYSILGVTRRWSLDEVCDFIGHSSRRMTERYAHITGGGLADQAAEQSIDRGRGSRVGHALLPALMSSPTANGGENQPPHIARVLNHEVPAALGVTGARDPRMTHAGCTAETAAKARQVLELAAAGDPLVVRRAIELAAAVLDEASAQARRAGDRVKEPHPHGR